jgi:hypothetical protein
MYVRGCIVNVTVSPITGLPLTSTTLAVIVPRDAGLTSRLGIPPSGFAVTTRLTGSVLWNDRFCEQYPIFPVAKHRALVLVELRVIL